MSERMIAFCGLMCDECPAFIAKKTDDDQLRRKTAGEWSTPEWPLSPKDINCDGCTSSGEVTPFCTVCEVRRCGLERKISNCAYCVDYPCEKLKMPWSITSSAKEVLDNIRKAL